MNRHIFQIGEKVVALTNPPDYTCQPRIKGKLYKVNDVLYCAKCGIQNINVSGKCLDKTFKNNLLCECGNKQNCGVLWWTHSEYFIRPEHLEDLMLEKANEEDYESAAEIKTWIEKMETV